MSAPTEHSPDIRDLLGMRSAAGWVLACAFTVSAFTMAVTASQGVHHLWIVVLAAGLLSGAGFAILLAPGDPMDVGYAVMVAAAAPLGAILALSQLPVPLDNAGQLWFLGATSAYLNFFALRGRGGFAWVALLGQITACATWTAVTGQGVAAGIGYSVMGVAPLLMGVFFTRIIRPMVSSIYGLRRRTAERAAEEVAATTAQRVRDKRLAHLDTAARPLLATIASGRELTPDEQTKCQLLESQLRDEILGGAMVDPTVAATARKARSRGVHVVLNDGGGLDDVADELRDRVRKVLAHELALARGERITARVLPPGRDIVVAILHHDDERRVDVTVSGTVRTDPANP